MVTLQELQARHSPEKQARIRAFAEELLKTFEANHATYVNARKALEAAEKERRRQKALARKRARAEAAKLRAAKAKAAEKAAKAEEKARERRRQRPQRRRRKRRRPERPPERSGGEGRQKANSPCGIPQGLFAFRRSESRTER